MLDRGRGWRVSHFADRLIRASCEHGPLCVGIDPHAGRIPDLFGGDTAVGVLSWAEAVIDCVKGRAGVVKPQVGLFERLGPQGFGALQNTMQVARDAGLLVLADAKRGDIGSTAEGYAKAYLADDAPFPADAVTVNPYMGIDTLEPFVRTAEEYGKGVIVLARTSNPGAADFQSKDLEGAPLYSRVVQALLPMGERLKGESGWSGLMLVTGATGPDEARELRALSPNALFLVPGYGAQGAGANEAVAGFVNGEGGVVNASRSMTFSKAANAATSISEWREAVTVSYTHLTLPTTPYV